MTFGFDEGHCGITQGFEILLQRPPAGDGVGLKLLRKRSGLKMQYQVVESLFLQFSRCRNQSVQIGGGHGENMTECFGGFSELSRGLRSGRGQEAVRTFHRFSGGVQCTRICAADDQRPACYPPSLCTERRKGINIPGNVSHSKHVDGQFFAHALHHIIANVFQR